MTKQELAEKRGIKGEDISFQSLSNTQLVERMSKEMGLLCECGCGGRVTWSSSRACWNRYLRGHGDHSRVVSADTKEKLRQANLGKSATEETRQKMRERRLGSKHSEETKAKISLAHRGIRPSELTRIKLRARPQSEEKRRKCREARLGKLLSEEAKGKIRQKLLGRRFSEETLAKKRGRRHSAVAKEKMREAALARWQEPEFQRMMSLKLGAGRHTRRGYREDLGFYARSSWEANFARILNFLEEEFYYEPKRFVIRGLHEKVVATYLSDFYLVRLDQYVDIKGFWDENSRAKITMFRNAFPDIKFDVVDSQSYRKMESKFSGLVPNWE